MVQTKLAWSPSTGGAGSAYAGAARLIMVQTLTIASRNFITSQDLSSVGEILGVSALDKCGAWMLGLSPGFGQAVRTFLIDAMVSAESGITTTGHAATR